MLIPLLAHGGDLTGPHDLWSGWRPDPIVVAAVVAALVVHRRGTRRRRVSSRCRTLAFQLSLVASLLALASPIDALADELASAHMVQHVLLVVVVAPLLAWSRPTAAVVAGSPAGMRPHLGAARRRLPTLASSSPQAWAMGVWLAHAAALWIWHASATYEAAVRNDVVHVLEHASFLGSAYLFWSVVLPRRSADGGRGQAALLTFGMALQSVFLAALLTFATTPWYGVYGDTSAWWGLDPLSDQQLAGALMWVPAGFVYVATGVLLMTSWLRENLGGDDAIDDWGLVRSTSGGP